MYDSVIMWYFHVNNYYVRVTSTGCWLCDYYYTHTHSMTFTQRYAGYTVFPAIDAAAFINFEPR